MKRDPDLQREIPLRTEAHGGKREDFVDLSELHDDADFAGYQVQLLAQEGFVEVVDARTDDDPYGFEVVELTPAGQEYLDCVRDPEAWRRVKEGARGIGDSSLDTLRDVAKAIVRAKLRKWTAGEFE